MHRVSKDRWQNHYTKYLNKKTHTSILLNLYLNRIKLCQSNDRQQDKVSGIYGYEQF